MSAARRGVVLALGTTQALAWASSYYLPAILADPIARDLGIPAAWVFTAFSAALLLSAMLGPAVGRAVDRQGGRGALCLSSLVFAGGLALLAAAQEPAGLAAAWLVLGVGMAMGLYDTAFATLAGLYGQGARGPITGITLIAGFASTVGWPVTAWLDGAIGWRGACLAWAGLHLMIGLPLNRLLPPAAPRRGLVAQPTVALGRGMVLLAVAFAAMAAVGTGMAAHLPRLLQASGASPAAAVAAAALLGPAQVAARLVELGLMRRLPPLATAALAAALHPLGALALAAWGGPAAAMFTLLHGASAGLLTIARGTLPLALFGPAAYGLRTGLLAAPARVAQAGAPMLFGVLLDQGWDIMLAVSAGLALLAGAALLALRLNRG